VYNFLNITYQSVFYHPKDVLYLYHKFDYKSKKSTLIICTRWLAWRKK